jgi:hypothetical protein
MEGLRAAPKSHLKMAHAFALFADIGLGQRTHKSR